MIYYGDEIGMRGGNDPDNRRDFPGGWNSDPRNAFTKAGRTMEEQTIYERVQRLALLRRTTPALREGRMMQLEADEQTYVYARVQSERAIIVAVNNSASPADIKCDVHALGAIRNGSSEDLLGGTPSAEISNGRFRIKMPGRTAGIYTY